MNVNIRIQIAHQIPTARIQKGRIPVYVDRDTKCQWKLEVVLVSGHSNYIFIIYLQYNTILYIFITYKYFFDRFLIKIIKYYLFIINRKVYILYIY